MISICCTELRHSSGWPEELLGNLSETQNLPLWVSLTRRFGGKPPFVCKHTCHICSDEVIFRVSTTKLGSSLEIISTMMYFQCKEEEWKQILNENLQICKSLNPLVWQILQRNKIRRLQKNFPLMATRVRWSRVCYFVGILMELMGSHD